MAAEVAQRFVPGAPPPAPLTKAQKKKRRTAKKEEEPHVIIPDAHTAALVESAPVEADIKAGSVAEELVAQNEDQQPASAIDDVDVKSSPVVDLLNKRIKGLHKKINRIHSYSSKPTSELNEDQKKTLQTLPSLEAAAKELEDVKKAVLALEVEQAKDAIRRHAEEEAAEKQKFADAVAATQKSHTTRTVQILDFIRLHSLLSSSDPSVQSLGLESHEITAIFTTAETLLGRETDAKHGTVSSFLTGEGEVEGVSHLRLLEITENFVNPPPVEEAAIPEDPVVETTVVTEVVVETIPEAVTEPSSEEVVVGIPNVGSIPLQISPTNFRFVQESEIEGGPLSFERDVEWVEKDDAPVHESLPDHAEATTNIVTEIDGSQEVAVNVVAVAAAPDADAAIDWADDEGGLPSIDGLHAKFGTSGTVTPAVAEPTVESDEAPRHVTDSVASPTEGVRTNGHSVAPAEPNGHATFVDEDGFVQARASGGRARGRARGTYRGGERGGFRGSFRGGERGSFRGYRLGERGRGKPFNPGNGHARGGADGEYRGRGRGRGIRGGAERGGRGGRSEHEE